MDVKPPSRRIAELRLQELAGDESEGAQGAAPLHVVRLAGAHDVHAFGSAARSFGVGRRDMGPRSSPLALRKPCRNPILVPFRCRFPLRLPIWLPIQGPQGGAIGNRAAVTCPMNTGDWAV